MPSRSDFAGICCQFALQEAGAVGVGPGSGTPATLNWLYVEPKKPKAPPPAIIPKTPEQVDWESLLYHGDRRLNRDLRGKKDRRKRAGSV